jgi:UPF0755 protein
MTKKIIILLILLAAIISLYPLKMIYYGEKNLGEERRLIVQEGEGAKKISQNLAKEGLIKSTFIFEAYLWLRGVEDNLQVGEYYLKPGISIRELVDILTSGKGNKEMEIKIIEGWNNREIAEYLENKGVMGKNVFQEGIKNYRNIDSYEFLKDKPAEVDLEGFLFPDTYRIYRDAKAGDIIKKMLNNFDQKLRVEMREDIKSSKRTIFEVITMASILEKEVSGENDRAIVADILYKRLKVGMPLQVDSTINYITGKGVSRASLEDTKINSPYNTYKNRGLPPGPISNPGLNAIEAAIYPIKNNYWYFLTTSNGKTIFSKTLEDHNIAKAKYLK